MLIDTNSVNVLVHKSVYKEIVAKQLFLFAHLPLKQPAAAFRARAHNL